jgi:hypothetical protein
LDLTDAAEIIGIVRDALLILLLAAALGFVLFVWRKVTSILDSTKRTIKGAESIFTTVSSKVVGPAAAGSGVAFGAGKVLAFLTGFAKRRRRDGGD